MKRNDDEIKTEVTAVLANREKLAQKQRTLRHSRLNDPAKAEKVEEARAARNSTAKSEYAASPLSSLRRIS